MCELDTSAGLVSKSARSEKTHIKRALTLAFRTSASAFTFAGCIPPRRRDVPRESSASNGSQDSKGSYGTDARGFRYPGRRNWSRVRAGGDTRRRNGEAKRAESCGRLGHAQVRLLQLRDQAVGRRGLL
jgi:hypothetical protein